MVAVPAATPVTRPFSTVATLSSEDVQIRVSNPPVTVTSTTSPSVRAASVRDIAKGFGVTWTGGGEATSLGGSSAPPEHRVARKPMTAMEKKTSQSTAKIWTR